MKKLLLIVLLFMLGCGSKPNPVYRIDFWSGGKVVLSWTTESTPSYNSNVGGFGFRDRETGKSVYIRGSWVATEVEQ